MASRRDFALRQGMLFIPAPQGNTFSVFNFDLGKSGLFSSVDLELIDRSTSEAIWSDTVSASIRRYVMLYTSSAMVYGRAGAFSLNVIPPPSDAGVDRRSLFGWHFAALRQGMTAAKEDLARTLEAGAN